MKKFKNLLISGIDESIHGSTVEKLVELKKIFECEMVHKNNKPTPELVKEWLLGLPSAIHVPYENDEIIAWYEKQLNRKVKEPKSQKGQSERERWLDYYWNECGKSLYSLLYK